MILGNLGWTAESFATIAQHQPTALGTAFVAAQALAVLGLAGARICRAEEGGATA